MHPLNNLNCTPPVLSINIYYLTQKSTNVPLWYVCAFLIEMMCKFGSVLRSKCRFAYTSEKSGSLLTRRQECVSSHSEYPVIPTKKVFVFNQASIFFLLVRFQSSMYAPHTESCFTFGECCIPTKKSNSALAVGLLFCLVCQFGSVLRSKMQVRILHEECVKLACKLQVRVSSL